MDDLARAQIDATAAFLAPLLDGVPDDADTE
jgi:hypothetical protein